jgi:hypothetical protein
MTQVSNSEIEKTLGFSPERPIVSRDADELGRVPFAESIAAAMKAWTGKDSLVLALYGDWGSGKSSLKNLIVESLALNTERSPYIVEFNPRQWAAQGQASQAFFREIGSELGRKDGGEEAKASARRWRRYGEFLGLGAEIFGGTRRIALVVLAAIAGFGVLGVVGAFFGVWVAKLACGVDVALSIALFVVRLGLGEWVESRFAQQLRSVGSQSKRSGQRK